MKTIFYRSDEIAAALCKGMLAANIPISKLENPLLRNALESGFGFKLPSETIMRQKYMPSCYEEVFADIKNDLKEGPIWISADCSHDIMGREVTNVIVGTLHSECYKKPHLVHMSFSDRANSALMARYIEKKPFHICFFLCHAFISGLSTIL